MSTRTSQAWIAAFEANPSGRNAMGWGFLVARQRGLAREPFKAGTVLKAAVATGYQTCGWLTGRIRDMADNLNRSRVRYSPTPAASAPNFDGANSNSPVFWVVSKLGLRPPAAPPGTYGYYGNPVD